MRLTVAKANEFYLQACELELQAFKPGNVSIYADGHGMVVDDFRISAKVSAPFLCDPELTLGERIFHAVRATRDAVGCNTNLGILLLCAPMIEAAYRTLKSSSFRGELADVLRNTSIEDAEWVFRAISLASPGGLGEVEEQDVKTKPSLSLGAAMEMASQRDRIAFQYVTNFKDVFEFGVLRYNLGLSRWGKMDWAAVAVYTGLLSHFADSHIERKYGDRYSELVAGKISTLDAALSDSSKPELLATQFYELDQEFKLKGINPGTTADLTVATILAVLLIDYLEAV